MKWLVWNVSRFPPSPCVIPHFASPLWLPGCSCHAAPCASYKTSAPWVYLALWGFPSHLEVG